MKDQEKESTVKITISVPELRQGVWMCGYEIGWPGKTRTSSAAGIDSVQAVNFALQKIGMEIYLSPHHASGNLRWEKAGDGYGFPVPGNGRDLLAGSDRTMDG